MEDSGGHLWVCAENGLYRYDSSDDVWKGRSKYFIADDGQKSQMIYRIMEAKDGTIWAGTGGTPGCLCRFDRGQFKTIQTEHPMIGRLLEDNYGNIWMGGWRGGGLTRYQAGESRLEPVR